MELAKEGVRICREEAWRGLCVKHINFLHAVLRSPHPSRPCTQRVPIAKPFMSLHACTRAPLSNAVAGRPPTHTLGAPERRPLGGSFVILSPFSRMLVGKMSEG